MISHVNINKSNYYNSSNSGNVIGTSNFPYNNIQNGSLFNTIVTSHKVIDTDSSVNIKYERTDQNNISEEISSHKNSA